VKYRAARSPLTWLGGLLALYLVVPLVAFLVRLSGPGVRGFGTPGLWPALWVSLQSATISVVLVTLFGIPLAAWLARSRGPVARLVGMLVLLPLALPPVMSGLVWIYLVGPYTPVGNFFNGDLTDTLAGVVIAQTFVAGPFLVIAARSAFEAIDPSLDDLAASLGHRPLARFWLVKIRLGWPGIRAGMLMTWLRAIGEYGATVLLAYHPFTLPVFTYVQFSATGIPTTQAPTALALGLAIVVLVISELRWPRRLRRPVLPPAPRAPAATAPTPVGFDLDLTVGSFRLRVAHQASSHRIAILGPSGSGKSVTLRALAGFFGPGAGAVTYGGAPVSAIPVEARRIGYVPQSRALFPGRTVWQQVLFATGADPALAAWWLRTLRLDGLAGRLPGQLSGGQQQRVTFARALAHRPRLVLLDEPFSALDAVVRDELRRELRRLQHETHLSTVLVTHDPEEAALLADEILVIDEGRVLQAGPRAEVFNHPASPAVARLLGIANTTHGTVAGPGAIASEGVVITARTEGLAAGSEVLWSIRPDHVAVIPDPAAHGAAAAAGGPSTIGSLAGGPATGTAAQNGTAGDWADGIPAVVDDVADIGTLTVLTVRLPGGAELRARVTDPGALAPGDGCRAVLDPAAITLWPASADGTIRAAAR
jgi:molybdate transport system ATP-binding protein/molybdate transport system permease protein